MVRSFSAIVDFAHTPNALRVAIETVRNMTDKSVIVVFGSAGLRDREKRRMMAEVSQELADISILTAEDPRTESLDGILADMAAGARFKRRKGRKNLLAHPGPGGCDPAWGPNGCSRRYGHGLRKGHEQSMCFGTIEYPWDDRVAMRAASIRIVRFTRDPICRSCRRREEK